MTWKPFFPDPLSASVFVVALVGFLAVAAYVDTKTFRIPKWLTLPLLGLGVAANIARGAWMGSLGKDVWMLGAAGPWVGAADGLLFALWGAVVAFAIYFGLWMLGVAKGGDVKLVTAIGAWIGAWNLPLFIVVSGAVLTVWAFGRVFFGADLAKRREDLRKHLPELKEGEVEKFARRGMSFSVPAAIATALVMMWAFRYDLQLQQPTPNKHHGSAHASAKFASR